MRYLIWKELRENLKWAVLGFLFVYFTMTYVFFSDNFYFESSSTIYFCSSVAAFLGFALGMIQIVFESAADRWAFLMHRPVSSRQVVLSKIIVGISLLTAIWVLVILLGIWQLVGLQKLAYPMYWFRPVPAFIATLVGIPAYLCGLMLVIWKPRSILGRISFLGPVVVLALTMGQFMTTLTWNFLWVAVAIILAMSALLFFTVLNTYKVSGEQSRANKVSNLSTLLGSIVGVFCILIVCAIIISLFMPAQSYALAKTGRLFYTVDGKVYRSETKYDIKKSEYIVENVENIKDSNDKLFEEETEKEELTLNQLTYKPKFSQTLTESGSPFYSIYSNGAFRYGKQYQLSLNESPGILTPSKHEGLIYLYQTPQYRNRYVATHRIGKNGYSTPFEGKPERFGNIILIDQSSSLVPTIRKGKFVGMNGVKNGKCLIVCSDAIYLLDGQEHEVEKIYSSPEGSPITNVAHSPDEKNPIFIVEHRNAYRIFKARTETAHAEETTAMDTKPINLYLPDKEIGLIARTSELEDFVLCHNWNFSTYYFSEKQSLLFVSDHPITKEQVEVNFQGEILSQERLNKSDFKLGNYSYQEPTASKLGILFIPPVFMGGTAIGQAAREEGMESIRNGIPKHWPFGLAYVVVWMALIAVSIWYCKKNRMTASQKNRCFWATLLFGPSGLLAFLFIEQPVHLDSCSNCSQKISVRFDTCSACGTKRESLAENPKNILNENLIVPKADGITPHQTTEAIST